MAAIIFEADGDKIRLKMPETGEDYPLSIDEAQQLLASLSEALRVADENAGFIAADKQVVG